MDEPLEERYFNWLCAKVVDVKNSTPSRSYDILLRTLHNTAFAWFVDGDDNRAADGVELRHRFCVMWGESTSDDWFALPSSFLEMLIALVDRAEFVSDISARTWFWQIITNIDCIDCTDDVIDQERIGDILEIINFRQYNYNGCGGLFPLSNPREDQRDIEIWYQFHTYLNDQDN